MLCPSVRPSLTGYSFFLKSKILTIVQNGLAEMIPKTLFIKKSLKFIYFTTITKQVIHFILIMLVGTDVCVRMVFVWEETCDHMTISHADAGYRTRVAAVRG